MMQQKELTFIFLVIYLFWMITGAELQCNDSIASDSHQDFVIYEVNFEIEKDVANDYMKWLKGHLNEMIIGIDGFISYKINSFERVKDDNDVDIVRRVVHWKVASQELLQKYFDTKAKQYRTAYPLIFKNRFKAWRRVITPQRNKHIFDQECKEFIHREQFGNDIPISYCLPSLIASHLTESNVSNLTEMYNTIKILESLIDSMNDSDDIIHNILYHFNVHSNVFRYYPHNNYTKVMFKYFQEKLYSKYANTYFKDEYKEYFMKYNINNYDDVNVGIIKKITVNHRINTHPFLQLLSDGKISLNLFEIFLNNYYVNNRAFHLMIGGLAEITPLKWRKDLYKNCYDECGSYKGYNYAHPMLFLSNFQNKTIKPLFVKPFTETKKLFNIKSFISFHSHSYQFSIGAFAFLETTMPAQMIQILSGARKLGYSESETIFWRSHIDIDLKHGKEWFIMLDDILKVNNKKSFDIIYGGLFLLEARCGIYDRMYALYQDELLQNTTLI
eukprot:495078_1